MIPDGPGVADAITGFFMHIASATTYPNASPPTTEGDDNYIVALVVTNELLKKQSVSTRVGCLGKRCGLA